MRLILAALGLWSVLLAGCNTPNSAAPSTNCAEGATSNCVAGATSVRTPVGVDHLFDIGADTTSPLFGASSIDVTDSVLYVLDRSGYRILAYDRQGQLRQQTGRRGRGPGELQSPIALVRTEKGVLVSEQHSPRAHRFDERLTYQDEALLKMVPVDLAGLSSGHLLVSGLSTAHPDRGTLQMFSPQREWESTPIPEPPMPSEIESSDIPLPARGLWKVSRVDSHGSRFCATFLHVNRVACATRETLTWTHRFPDLPETAEVRSIADAQVPDAPLTQDIAVAADGTVFVLSGGYGPDPEHSVYVLADGKHVRTLRLAYAAERIAWQPPNRLYALREDGTRITAYRILAGENPTAATKTHESSKRSADEAFSAHVGQSNLPYPFTE